MFSTTYTAGVVDPALLAGLGGMFTCRPLLGVRLLRLPKSAKLGSSVTDTFADDMLYAALVSPSLE